MELVKRNWQGFGVVVRAWRVASWASHAWGNLGVDSLAEVWNARPSLAGFTEILPGYAVARGWLQEGPAGWGILAPELVGRTPDEQGLRVWVGSHSQLRVDCYPQETIARYEHGERWAQAAAEGDGSSVYVVGAQGNRALARDWARISRVLIVAHGLSSEEAEGVKDCLRHMCPPHRTDEFDLYTDVLGPTILAAPELILPTA